MEFRGGYHGITDQEEKNDSEEETAGEREGQETRHPKRDDPPVSDSRGSGTRRQPPQASGISSGGEDLTFCLQHFKQRIVESRPEGPDFWVLASEVNPVRHQGD